MDRPICGAAAKRGEPCRAFALPGGRCWSHAPERAAERRAAYSKGAKLKAINGRRPRLDDAAGLLKFNADLVNRLLVGELEADVVRCLVYALTLQKSLIEVGELERRLEVLERQLPIAGRKAWA